MLHQNPLQRFYEPSLTILNMGKFKITPLERQPFHYVVVPKFINQETFAAILADYPVITKAGSFPLDGLQFGPAFEKLIDELESSAFRKAVEEKFSIDLSGRPSMITVRGRCLRKNGTVHTDTESKIISMLIYMNPKWDDSGGKLRLLRSEHIEDVAIEIPASQGAMVIFRRSNCSWHGHKPFTGERKVIQLNWMVDQKSADRNLRKHSVTSFLKQFIPTLRKLK